MASLCRLATSRLHNQILRNGNIFLAIRTVTMKAIPHEDPKNELDSVRNERIGRPISPHVTIYKFELPAIVSISHRITGIALTTYAFAFGIGALVLPESIPHYIDAMQSAITNYGIGRGPICAGKFLLSFPLAFHMINGVRHLVWDMGKFLKLKEVYNTGYATVIGAIIMSTVLAVM